MATVDAESGAVTILAAGTTTITATFAGNDEYNSASASYTLTVKAEASDDENSADNPYTVAEAQALFDNDALPAEFVYVKGIVSTITEVNSQYGNATYYISDDGTETGQLLVFRGKYLDGDSFTSEDQLQVGDTVVVYGNLILYKTSTRELNQGNYLISLSRPEGTTPVEPVDGNRYELVEDAATLAADDEVVIAYIDEKGTAYALSTTQNNNNRAATTDLTLNNDGTLTPGDEVQIITLEKDGTNFLFNVGKGYLYAASSDKNWLRTEVEADANAKAAISIATDGTATIVFQGSNERKELHYNPNVTNNAPLFSCYAEGAATGSLPQIYRKVAAPVITLAGDVNKDGSVTIADVTALVNIILGKDNVEPYQYDHDAADVNADGSVTIADVTALVNKILGK